MARKKLDIIDDIEDIDDIKSEETPEVVEGEVLNEFGYSSSIKVMTAKQYKEYSKQKGTVNGRKKNQKTILLPEELLMMVKHGYTIEDIMEKHGITESDVNSVVNRLKKMVQFSKPFVIPRRNKLI